MGRAAVVLLSHICEYLSTFLVGNLLKMTLNNVTDARLLILLARTSCHVINCHFNRKNN